MNMPGSDSMARWLEEVWLSRYLDRELKDDEQAWFEAYMLDKPYILEQVDADTRLRDGLAQATDVSKRIGSAQPARSSAAAGTAQRSPGLAIAASLLLGLSIGALIPGMRGGGTDIVASPPRIVFDTLRGESTATLSEPGGAGSKLLIVDIATSLDSPILAANAWIDGKQTALPTPVVSSDGFITFVVPADWQRRARIELEMGIRPNSSKVSFQL